MKAHEIKSQIIAATGRDGSLVHHDDHCFTVHVLGDEPENVAPVAAALRAASIPFRVQQKGKKFAGATYVVPIHNTGTAFHADWHYGEL